MIKKPKDEWGIVIEKQSELNRLRAEEEKQRAQAERERYRQELEQQAYYRQLQKEEELRQKEQDAAVIRQQVKSFEAQERQKKAQLSYYQKALAEEYSNQTNSLKYRQEQDLKSRLFQEKQEQLKNQSLLFEERQQKLQTKEKMHQEDLSMLESISAKNYNKKIEAKMEMQREADLLRQQKERIDKQEQDYRNYFKRVDEDQSLKQRVYANQVATKLADRDSQRTSWIDKNVYEYKQQEQERLQRELRLKQNNLENVKETLRSQLEEKNRLEQKRAEEKKLQTEEMQRKIEENKRLEEEKMRNRKAQQIQYFSNLHSQATEVNDIRNGEFKMTELEKRLNKNYSIDANMKNNFSIGAQEILRGNQKSSSVFEMPINNSVQNKKSSNSALSASQPFEGILPPASNRLLRPSALFS